MGMKAMTHYLESSGVTPCLGMKGNDTIYGGFQGDHLIGGAGNDYLSGGNGYDEIFGGDGDDTLVGGRRDDTMTGGESGSDPGAVPGVSTNQSGLIWGRMGTK